MPTWQTGAIMDDNPLDPPPSTRGFATLRERAPVLFGEAIALAAVYPEELGKFPHVLCIIWTVTHTLPDDRANLIPSSEIPPREQIGDILHLVYRTGNLRPKFGLKTTFPWPGEMIQELEGGLASIAMNGTTPKWREAASAAYDLLLRILATIYNDYEVVC